MPYWHKAECTAIRPIITLLLSWCWLGMAAQSYAVPVIPDSLTDSQERADYVATRFWDGFMMQDTTLLRPDYGEQATADFLSLLPYTSDEGRRLALSRWIERSAESMEAYRYFMGMAEHYLCHQVSPLHNDSLYLLLAQQITSSPVVDEATYSHTLFRQQQLSQNQVGSIAQDFSYISRSGTTGTLHTLTTAHPILLVFYDPACDDCQYLLFRLQHSIPLKEALAQGRLTLLAVYTENDPAVWEQTKDELPATWTVVSDAGEIRAHASYDLETIPVMFLLDKDKRVLQRDITIHQLTQALSHY